MPQNAFLTTTEAVMLPCSMSIMSIAALTLHPGLYGSTSSCLLTLGALKPETLTLSARDGNRSSSADI